MPVTNTKLLGFEHRLVSSRIIYASIAVSIFLGHWFHRAFVGEHIHDSLAIRAGFSLFSLTCLTLTFIKTKAHWAGQLSKLLFIALTLYAFYLAYENNLEESYSLGVFIIIAVVAISAEDKPFLIAFVIAGSLAAIAVSLYTAVPLLDPYLYGGSSVILLTAIYYLSARRIATSERLELTILALAEESERANNAARAKGDFLAAMSHEIRTPLNGIIPVVNLLRDTELSEDQKHYLNIVEQSGELLIHIINDVLDLSKIEKGRIDLENREFNLYETVHHITQLHKASAQQKQIELHDDISLSSNLFQGDETRIKQVLNNLVSNAVKFTPEGSVIVSVKITHETENEANVLFQVTDTGIGISLDKQELIFDAFAQAESSTSRRFGGTGLGLAICKQLVTLMGSKLEVQSPWLNQDRVPKKGSRFSFTLTLAKVQPQDNPKANIHQVDQQQAIQTKKLHTLVVEDNPVNRMILGKILEKSGVSYDEAHDGFEALKKADERQYDIIFMDVEMPGMNGYEASEKLVQGNSINKETPIVCITAHAFSGDIEKARQSGMQYFIAKPFKAGDLRDLLHNIPVRGS